MYDTYYEGEEKNKPSNKHKQTLCALLSLTDSVQVNVAHTNPIGSCQKLRKYVFRISFSHTYRS